MKVRNPLSKEKGTDIISLRSPGQGNLKYIKWTPKEREDGWKEVIVWEFNSKIGLEVEYVPMDLKLTCFEGSLSGLIVCGIEFRPM